MNELIFVLLFAAGSLLSVGAYTDAGGARGFGAILGFFFWLVLGNAVVSLTHITQTGTTVTYGAESAAWLLYLNAIGHVLALIVAIVEAIEEREAEASEATQQVTDGIPQWARSGGD